MSMEIHVFQHADEQNPGLITDWAVANDIKLIIHRPDTGENLTPLNAHDLDGVILLGGPQQIGDGETWMAAERILVRSMDKIGRPVFGIDFGAQQIARAFGAPVLQMNLPELGRGLVQRADGSEMPVFQWHHMAIGDLPGSTVSYRNQAAATQGFTYHHRICGIQFHLEATLAMQKAMIDASEFSDLPHLSDDEETQAYAELNQLLNATFL
ncbi:type 1 glutamine amidotransferase [Lacticaseibacillus sp. GG6-2]